MSWLGSPARKKFDLYGIKPTGWRTNILNGFQEIGKENVLLPNCNNLLEISSSTSRQKSE